MVTQDICEIDKCINDYGEEVLNNYNTARDACAYYNAVNIDIGYLNYPTNFINAKVPKSGWFFLNLSRKNHWTVLDGRYLPKLRNERVHIYVVNNLD